MTQSPIPYAGDEFTEADSRELKAVLERVHELLCKQNRINGGNWTFDGWLPDGRAVKHKFQLRGYQRTGPTVNRERTQLGLPTPPAWPSLKESEGGN